MRLIIRSIKFCAAGIALCSVIPLPASASDNLWSIYQKAINNDPVIMQRELSYQADQEFIEQAKSGLRPQVNAGVGAGRVNDDIDGAQASSSGDVSYNNANANIRVSQILWDKGLSENLELAKNQVHLSKLQLDTARQDLLIRISNSYFNLLAAEDTLQVTRKESDTLRQQFEQADQLLNAGLGTSTDYFQTQSRYQLAEVEILTAQNTIADNRQALMEIIGEPVAELAKPGPNYPIEYPEPNSLESWLDIALKNNHDLAAAHQSADIARQSIHVTRSGFWPSLSLNAEKSFNDNDDGLNGELETTRRSVSLDLTAPIYQGGQVRSQTREAAKRYSASLKNTDSIKRSIERQVRDAFNTVHTSKNQVVALQSAVKAAQNALQARQQSFESGLSTNIEVLDATRDLFSSQRDLLQARYNYITSMFNLKGLAGILNESDFRQTSDLLTQ